MKPRRFVCTAPALIILLTAWSVFPFGGTGMGGAVIPHPSLGSKNPAYEAYPARFGYNPGIQLPVGLLGLLPAERNPFLYATNRDTFRSRFDFLQFYDQVSYPSSFLLNPPVSPEKVMLSIEEGSVRIEDGRGNPLVFRETMGTRGISVGGTPLIPPPLLSLPLRTGNFYFKTGFFGGGGGYRFYPDTALSDALEAAEFSPHTQYSIRGGGSIQSGISQSLTFAAPVFEGHNSRTFFGVRLLLFYMAGFVDGDVHISMATDARALPVFAGIQWNYFYLYPGMGGGYGMRLDSGAVFDRGPLTFGIGFLNLLGFAQLHGYASDFSFYGTEEEVPESRTFSRFLPGIFSNVAYELRSPFGKIVLTGDIGYVTGWVMHGGFLVIGKRTFFRMGAGWDGASRFGTSFGLRAKKKWFELALTTHEAPLVGGMVFGIAFHTGRYFLAPETR